MTDKKPWKCPDCGTDNATGSGECPCGYCLIPLELHLLSHCETSTIAMRISTPVGRRLLAKLVCEEDLRFAAEEQFILTKDQSRGNWFISTASRAKNPTHLNGVPVPTGDGASLNDQDVITVGKTKCRIKVVFP